MSLRRPTKTPEGDHPLFESSTFWILHFVQNDTGSYLGAPHLDSEMWDCRILGQSTILGTSSWPRRLRLGWENNYS